MLISQKYRNIHKKSFSLKEKILLNNDLKIDNKKLKKELINFGIFLNKL